MSTVSELLGIDERIKRMVEDALDSKSFTRADVKESIKQHFASVSSDVYANMKKIEEFKYKIVELETKLDNLAKFCKQEHTEEG